MPTGFGSLRRLVFTPSLASVTFAGRGFPGAGSAAAPQLEAIPHAVIAGFEAGIDARGQQEIEWRIRLLEPQLRGFGYEGATMALTILDVFTGGRRRLAQGLLLGPAADHIFLTYIGIGFAMSRLPKRVWSRVLPDLSGSPYYPTLSWLAVDGYGFDRAYFDTRRWVDQQYQPRPYPWQGAPEYFPRALDQGIGRALWFIHGAVVPQVAAAVGRFAEHRRADLWSGVGLAAAFAGGTDADGLARLRSAAGDHLPELAQGAVFAAKARSFAGLVTPHTGTATEVLCGLSAGQATELADAAAAAAVAGDPTGAGPGSDPDYEQWRARVRRHFVPVGPAA